MAQTTQPGLPATMADLSRRIVAADRVEGTAVFNRAGEKLGIVDHIMIDKTSGQVCYVILSLLARGSMEDPYCPLPWEKLAYDEGKDGFVVDLDGGRLAGAPRSRGRQAKWDATLGRRVDGYFGLPTRWTPDA